MMLSPTRQVSDRTIRSPERPRLKVRAVRALGQLLNRPLRHPCPTDVARTDAGYGYDPFGAHRDWIVLAHGMTSWLYDHWFRVRSTGHENIPQAGAVILAANHSGGLPYDGAMIWTDVLRHTNPARVVRPVADYFVPRLPFVGAFMTRSGVVGGSVGNARALVELGEALLIFPEGTEGIVKPFWHRYRLATWTVGHVELAIRYRVPVVPVGIVGAEEQMPQVGRIPFGLLGVPYLPVMFPVPLPVRYHIEYGKPIDFSHLDSAVADRPERLDEAAARVRQAVERLVACQRAARRGWFV